MNNLQAKAKSIHFMEQHPDIIKNSPEYYVICGLILGGMCEHCAYKKKIFYKEEICG